MWPNITVGITTCDRPQGYKRTIDELRRSMKGHDVKVVAVQDGGERYVEHEEGDGFNVFSLVQHGNKGKKRYWETVDLVLRCCSSFHADLHVQLPDDLVFGEDWWALVWNHIKDMPSPFAMNMLMDHRESCWGHRNFVDGAFVADRQAMDLIDWHILPVDVRRWDKDPTLSSGVWKQVTERWGGIIQPKTYAIPLAHDWSAPLSRMNPDRAWCR